MGRREEEKRRKKEVIFLFLAFQIMKQAFFCCYCCCCCCCSSSSIAFDDHLAYACEMYVCVYVFVSSLKPTNPSLSFFFCTVKRFVFEDQRKRRRRRRRRRRRKAYRLNLSFVNSGGKSKQDSRQITNGPNKQLLYMLVSTTDATIDHC